MKRKPIARLADERETTGRLLDAAERLFGEYGYDGVGMRKLAKEAKVNLGAATYHFGSKKALYIETFMRRFRPANAERLRLLREAEGEGPGRPLSVERIVDYLVRPPYVLGLRHPNFHALVARNIFMPPPFLDAAIYREMEPNIEVFVTALHRSLPGVPEDLVRLRVMFAMGSLLMFSVQMSRMGPTGNLKFEEGFLKELIGFISAGLQGEPAVPASERPFRRVPKPPRG